MSKRLSGLIFIFSLSLPILIYAQFSAAALPTSPSGSALQWLTTQLADFSPGTVDGTDIWSSPDAVVLDRGLYPNVRVSENNVNGKFHPRLTHVDQGGTTHFLTVWADENVQDHYPDIYFSSSSDDGQNWAAGTLVSGAHVNNRRMDFPDIAVDPDDGSYWVVWQDAQLDDGDIYYARSSDQGGTWGVRTAVYGDMGTQKSPRIAAGANLHAIWEDERGDDGDIFISRYTTGWSVPVKINDDSGSSAQSVPAVAADGSSGNVYAVWVDQRSNDDGEIYFSSWISGTVWSAAGWSTNSLLSDETMDWATSPDIAVDGDGNLVATWVERVPTGPATYDFQVVAARSVDQGANWTPVVVDLLTDAAASNAFYGETAVAADGDGNIYVTWLYSPDSQAATAAVYLAVSADDGVNWSVPRVVNNFTGSQQADVSAPPAIAADDQGQVVIAWTDFRDGSATRVYASGYPGGQYLPNGTYLSPVFDAIMAEWGTISWAATNPTGTTLTLSTRTRANSADSWGAWQTHSSSGEALPHADSGQIQYRIAFSANGTRTATPQLESVTITYVPYENIFLPLIIKE
jgi:hypothetical protein